MGVAPSQNDVPAGRNGVAALVWPPVDDRLIAAASARCIFDPAGAALYRVLLRVTQACELRSYKDLRHIWRIRRYALALARCLGMSREDQRLLAWTAPFHDIGLLAVPEKILEKDAGLTPYERERMKLHTTYGAEILGHRHQPELMIASQIALTHHERWDGSGYPQGLEGRHIPLAGRIVALADAYDDLRQERFRPSATDHPTACGIILHGNGLLRPDYFDPFVLEAFGKGECLFAAIFARQDRQGLPYEPALW